MRASIPILVVACCALCASALAQTPPSRPAPVPAASAPAAAPPASGTPAAGPAAPSARPAPAPPTEAQRTTARSAYTRGQAAFADGRYEEARAAFQEAYAAVPNPVVLVSLAECELRLGRFDEALTGFERYLRDRPDAADRVQVEQKIKDLQATPSILVLTSTPSGASVKLDGAETGKVTPIELSMPRGSHRVELALAGHLPIAETVEVGIGARHEVHVGLQPAPVAPPPPPPAPPEPLAPPPPPPESPTTALWITSIVGAAGLVSGTVLGFMALSERSDFDANPTIESADRGERLALFADVAFGVGAMALITGAVLYLTHDETPPPVAKQAGLQITPVAASHGAGLTARVRY